MTNKVCWLISVLRIFFVVVGWLGPATFVRTTDHRKNVFTTKIRRGINTSRQCYKTFLEEI